MIFSRTAGKNIYKLLCLLVLTVGILWFNGNTFVSHATEEHHLSTGDTTTSTVIDPAVTYDDPEDLNTINTVNRITLTYEGDNGSASIRALGLACFTAFLKSCQKVSKTWPIMRYLDRFSLESILSSKRSS